MNRKVWRLVAPVTMLGGALVATSALAQENRGAGFDFGVPLQAPFVCENEAHKVALTPITGEPCQAAAVVDYVYRNAENKWGPFDQAAELLQRETSPNEVFPLKIPGADG